MYSKTLKFALLFACLFAVAGCEKSPPPNFRFNSVELLKQERLHLSGDDRFDEGYKQEIGSILTTLFGTPDEPKFPYFLGEDDPAHDIISLDNLKFAAGAVKSGKEGEHQGLYREHCAHCHGVTGDGAGPTASVLNPYPRDFRLSKFKFKSTPLRQPPTDDNLMTILKNGIPGTAMPSFQTLPEEELQALVEYVKYLTIRGQYERYLISEVAGLDGRSLIDLSLVAEAKEGEEPSDDDIEEFEDQMYTIIGEGLQEGIIERWLKPDRKVTKIPPAPEMFDINHASHEEFVLQGRELYFTKGNCLQCHGQTGIGDGQLSNFDDWTNDWIKSANVDPFFPDTYADFIAAGALPPRPIHPRNLHLPVYRGGSHPDDIYLRLANGIEGTPMPASAALSSDEIWKIVAFVRALPYEKSRDQVELPVNDKEISRQ